MAKSQQTYNKKEKEKKRLKKRQDKQAKKEERRANASGGSLDDMIMYLDEDGNFTDMPPDPTKKKKEIKASSIELGIPKADPNDKSSDKEGKVSYFDDSKGFGFILDSVTQEKYFVHVSGLIDEIEEGDKVSFELERGMKGMNAVQVKKI